MSSYLLQLLAQRKSDRRRRSFSTDPDSAQPDAFLLLTLPDASLTSASGTDNGSLNLECVSRPNPKATNTQDSDPNLNHNVYLVLRLNTTETVIDPARAVTRTDAPHIRTYTFTPTPLDPAQLILRLKVPAEGKSDSNPGLSEKLEAFENVLKQYLVSFNGPSPAPVAPVPQGKTPVVGLASANQDLRGHLVMINEDTGEVIGEVEDKFKIKEDSALRERGHENDPVVIELAEKTTNSKDSDANASVVAVARIVPPDQQDWITKSASVVSDAISKSTNHLITTLTTASDHYVSHSAPGAPRAPDPLPADPLALFLTSPETRKGISTAYTISGEAVKISSQTLNRILISADLIRSTLDNSMRKVLDSGTASLGKVVTHKYGPEAAESLSMMAGTVKNVGLVYIDMHGIGHRVLSKAGVPFLKARL